MWRFGKKHDKIGKQEEKGGPMEDGSISIAVISDTHGFLRRSVVAELEGCQAILHAGDIIKRSDLDELALYGSLFTVML